MARHRVEQDNNKVSTRALLLTAASCGALAIGALTAAGPANASCASFNGRVNVGKGCSTTDKGDIAIGIGRQTDVTASGGRNVAIAIGNPGPRAYVGGATEPASAYAVGNGNRAFAFGNGAGATAYGVKNAATAFGNGSLSAASGYFSGGVQNRSFAFGPQNEAIAFGGVAATNEPGKNTAVVVGRSSIAHVNYANIGTKNTNAVALGKDKFVSK